MKYAVIGVGGIGGYYGGLLAHHGFDVHFLLKSDFVHVAENGLIVESKNGDFTLPNVNAYLRVKDMPKCDVVIIALKTTQNFQLESILPHVVKKNGIVIILQNGLGVEEDVAEILGNDVIIIGGLCFICSTKIGPGHIKHFDYGSVRFGEYAQGYKPAGVTKNLKYVYDLFKEIGVSVQLSENIGEARWRKLVWNMPFNGLSVVLDATTDKIIKDKYSRKLVEEIMMEVISGANKCGYHIEEEFAYEMIKNTESMIPYKPSMKHDYDKGQKMEIEKIYLKPISDAEKAGFEMKTSKYLALQLEFLDGREG